MSSPSGPPETVEVNGTTFKSLADGEYDAIVLGTGLKECILSGLLATDGMRVLVVDRNGYYGGEAASLNLTNLYRKFRDADPPAEVFERLGHNRFYNVDLIPKFIMADGKLVRMLLHTGVNHYLDFKNVDGSYVFKGGKKAIFKVPATEMEALKTPLMGFFQKRKFRNFLKWVASQEDADYGRSDTSYPVEDTSRMVTHEVYSRFGLDDNTRDFTGHALALHLSDDYLEEPVHDTVRACKLYAHSLERYGRSPYLYPLYGLGGLPEGFSRLCAIKGGVFMLNTDVDEILFNEDGAAVGVRSGEMAARANLVVGDPSYFPREKTRPTHQVVRSIFIMDHPIPHTDDAESCQIIVPYSQVAKAGYPPRKHDIYVSCVSASHMVAAAGKYVAIVSTTVETSNPLMELEVAVQMLGPWVERFDQVSQCYEPVADGTADRCFISTSYDATSHFETTSQDVLALYERITGKPLAFRIPGSEGSAASGAGSAEAKSSK